MTTKNRTLRFTVLLNSQESKLLQDLSDLKQVSRGAVVRTLLRRAGREKTENLKILAAIQNIYSDQINIQKKVD